MANKPLISPTGMTAPLTLTEYVCEFPIGTLAKTKEELTACVIHKDQWKHIVKWAEKTGRIWANNTEIQLADDSFKEGPYTLLYFQGNRNDGTTGLARTANGFKEKKEAIDFGWKHFHKELPINFAYFLPKLGPKMPKIITMEF